MKPYFDVRQSWSRRRGAVAVMTGVTLVVLLVFASFAVDLGFMRAVCGDMQHTADTGALAGASALRESDGQDTDGAYARAIDVVERMLKTLGFSALDDQVIETGTWNSITGQFTAVDPGSGDKAFAVRVVGVRNKTPYFFAGIIGKHSTNVTREAVALASGVCAGIWGLEGVKAGSINTDSYDSTEGAYDALTARENGDICSGRHITVSGSFNVHGDVMPGFGYGLTVNGASGEITGYTTSNSGALPEVDTDFGNVKYDNDNDTIPKLSTGRYAFKSGSAVSIASGASLTLPGGTYYFDTLQLTGGATIAVTGPTTVYIGGDADLVGGAILNSTTDPHNLTIIASGTSIKLNGGSVFYGTILAPNAAVSLGSNAVFYGAVIGKTLVLSGDTHIHVDESLPFPVEAPLPSLVK